MNPKELKAEIVRAGLTIEETAKRIGISKKSMYQRLNGNVQFRQKEIFYLKKLLSLSDAQVNTIFFD